MCRMRRDLQPKQLQGKGIWGQTALFYHLHYYMDILLIHSGKARVTFFVTEIIL